MIKICYKVVRVTDNGLVSTNDSCPHPVRYVLGERILPTIKHSKLFVFDSFEHAKRFASNEQEIWMVLANNPEPASCRMHTWDDSYRYEEYWKMSLKEREDYAYSYNCPKGTLFCDSLWMLQRAI
jgi:hypothetical protein